MTQLTTEQKDKYDDFKASIEYRTYMDEMLKLKAPLTEAMLEPYIWCWFFEENYGIKFEVEPRAPREITNGSAKVYDCEEDFLKANPHIVIPKDIGYSEQIIENNNISITVNDA